MENVTDLKADGEDFRWYMKVSLYVHCANRVVFQGGICESSVTLLNLPHCMVNRSYQTSDRHPGGFRYVM